MSDFGGNGRVVIPEDHLLVVAKAVAEAPDVDWDRAVYLDGGDPRIWVNEAEAAIRALERLGYTIMPPDHPGRGAGEG